MTKFLMLMCISVFLCGVAAAQQAGNPSTPSLLPGTVSGDIVIDEVSGNHLGNFSCGNLTAYVSSMNGEWKRKATATGSFSRRRCSYKIANVPAGVQFRAVLTAQFPNACDEKKFEPNQSFPMKLKGREQLRYNFGVSRIRCVLVK